MKKYRFFKLDVGWSVVLFIIPMDISFKELKSLKQTSELNSDSFIGEFELPDLFVSTFHSNNINNKVFYYEYTWHKNKCNKHKSTGKYDISDKYVLYIPPTKTPSYVLNTTKKEQIKPINNKKEDDFSTLF